MVSPNTSLTVLENIPPFFFCGTISLNDIYDNKGVGGGGWNLTAIARGRTVGATSTNLVNFSSSGAGQIPFTFGAECKNMIFVGQLVVTGRSFTNSPFAPAAEYVVYRRDVILATDINGLLTVVQNITNGTDFETAALSAVSAPTVSAVGPTLVISATGIAGRNIDWRATLDVIGTASIEALWPTE
jgi:hypothetical protein